MYMKRTIILLSVFAILGSVTAWYLLQTGDDKTTLAGADRRFAVKEREQIRKIFLADRTGERVTLERKGDHWIYNDQYRARPSAVNNLLEAITQVEIKFKPPVAAVETMIKSLATEGIKVEVYGAGDELLRSYYVGGATPDETGTFMLMAEAEQPYVTYLPGWSGNLRFRYNLRGNEWRDRTVFSAEPESIQSVVVEYPKQRNKSFRLEKRDGGYQVEPYYDITPRINRPLRPGSVEAFLEGFESIGAEAFQNTIEERDSIANLIPFSIIRLTRADGEETEVRLHPIVKKGNIDPKTGQEVGSGVIERYYADVVSSGDFMLVQHRVFQEILWAYDFFYQ